MLLPQKQKEYDYFFIKNMLKISTKEEIKYIMELLDREDREIDVIEREKIELFIMKVKERFGSWKDSLHGLYHNFGMDIFKIATTSVTLSGKLGVEYKPPKTYDVMEMING